MSIVQQINLMVEQLPEIEQRLILELIRRINPDDTFYKGCKPIQRKIKGLKT